MKIYLVGWQHKGMVIVNHGFRTKMLALEFMRACEEMGRCVSYAEMEFAEENKTPIQLPEEIKDIVRTQKLAVINTDDILDVMLELAGKAGKGQ